jgi:hypothetical protein
MRVDDAPNKERRRTPQAAPLSGYGRDGLDQHRGLPYIAAVAPVAKGLYVPGRHHC